MNIHYTDFHANRFIKEFIINIIPNHVDEIVLLCIGTDCSTGDALGPLVGKALKKFKYANVHIYGDLKDPVHALNLEQYKLLIKQKHPRAFVIAVDSGLSSLKSIGKIQAASGPLKPGSGVKKKLASVGDAHIMGIVNVGGFMEQQVLQNTRLFVVMEMAEIISEGIMAALRQNKQYDRVV